MSKYVYEALYDSDFNLIAKNKYTVVYENKEFVYLKVNGSNRLNRLSRDFIQDHFENTADNHGRYFWNDFEFGKSDKLIKNFKIREKIREAKEKKDFAKRLIETATIDITKADETMKKLRDQLIPSIQIIGGGGLRNAFNELNISAVCLYRSKRYSQYEVWEVLMNDFEILERMDDDAWKEDWGWWCFGATLYQGATSFEYVINGKPMLGYVPDNLIGDPKKRYYTDFYTWIHEVFNLSSEVNFTEFAHSLACDNNMTLDEFMRTYQP